MPWNALPQEIVQSISVNQFKNRLDKYRRKEKPTMDEVLRLRKIDARECLLPRFLSINYDRLHSLKKEQKSLFFTLITEINTPYLIIGKWIRKCITPTDIKLTLLQPSRTNSDSNSNYFNNFLEWSDIENSIRHNQFQCPSFHKYQSPDKSNKLAELKTKYIQFCDQT
ncbi:hypothetical protein BpHYR1_037347 [Brachionus plicatilis]|uniref:RNA-directed DNA polymerase from mobile element jockey-like n=1 Tax=Brachionus plicatilis TaxID=10195 RepID=A0A3M7PK68_BRAPC|nr:hypothetical protein BpHYR1_037347 [Brachionus plicatilis]